MAKNPPVGNASQKEVDDYFARRDRALTEHVLRRNRSLATEPLLKSKPVEYVELFNSIRIQKNYGDYTISYESGRGFRKKPANSSNWGQASPDEIKAFRDDAKAAAGQDPDIARYIANDSNFQ